MTRRVTGDPCLPVGICLWGGMRPSESVACLVAAEAAGFESAWMNEGRAGDAFAILAATAARTSRIRLGTSVLSVFVRSPAIIGLGAATLHDVSGGRFVLGLGISHEVQVSGEHGLAWDRPFTRLRETIEIVRDIVGPGVSAHRGDVFSLDFEASMPPLDAMVPIFLAALGPHSVDLAARTAEGAILAWQTQGSIRDVNERVARACAAAGKDRRDFTLASLVPCRISEDVAAAADEVRDLVAFYCGAFPRYRDHFGTLGFPEESARISEVWRDEGRERARRFVPDSMVRAFALVSRPVDLRDRLEEYLEAGLDLPILHPAGAEKAARGSAIDTIEAWRHASR